jgi:hypothetical protein
VLACLWRAWKTRAVRAVVVGRLAALGAMVVTLGLCAAARAHRGDGVFNMPAGPWLDSPDDDDGAGVLLAGGSGTDALAGSGQA